MKSPDGRECSTWVQHKRIVLTGRRTTSLCLLNPHERRVERVEVDGCAITEGIRCDWLILLDDSTSKEEMYVELKTSSIGHAIKQLEATIGKLSIDSVHVPKRCLVVLSRNPMAGTDVQICKARFHKHFNAVFLSVRDKAEIRL